MIFVFYLSPNNPGRGCGSLISNQPLKHLIVPPWTMLMVCVHAVVTRPSVTVKETAANVMLTAVGLGGRRQRKPAEDDVVMRRSAGDVCY